MQQTEDTGMVTQHTEQLRMSVDPGEECSHLRLSTRILPSTTLRGFWLPARWPVSIEVRISATGARCVAAPVEALGSDAAAVLALDAPKENAGAATVDADAVCELSVLAAGAEEPAPAPNLNGAADPLEAPPSVDGAAVLGFVAAVLGFVAAAPAPN